MPSKCKVRFLYHTVREYLYWKFDGDDAEKHDRELHDKVIASGYDIDANLRAVNDYLYDNRFRLITIRASKSDKLAVVQTWLKE